MTPPIQWFVTADECRARLHSCERTATGRVHVEQHDETESTWDLHEKGRPSALGRGPSANASQHFAGAGHDAEEQRRRFARDLKSWLDDVARDHEINRLTLFAAPKMLGALRDEIGPADRIAFEEAELTRLRPHELAEHPAIANALNPAV